MVRNDKVQRACAAAIAMTAWAGLILEYDATLLQAHSILRAFWAMFGFFTIITNLAVALFFTHIATHGSCCAHPRKLAGLTLATLLVGIVYRLLLQDGDVLVGYEVQANLLLHNAVPIMMALYWLGCATKGHVGQRDPLLWAVYPIVYLVYALARAAAGDGYAYPFIDPAGQGWSGVALNVTSIAVGFMAAGYGLFWLDRKMAGYDPAPAKAKPARAGARMQTSR